MGLIKNNNKINLLKKIIKIRLSRNRESSSLKELISGLEKCRLLL
jgi:hypothetical protein